MTDDPAIPQRGPVETWLRAAQDHGRWPPDEAVWTAKARAFDAAFDALERALRPYAAASQAEGCTDEPHSWNDWCGCDDFACRCHHAGAIAALARAEGVRS